MQAHRDGKRHDAVGMYRRILKRDAGNADAWHLLGLALGEDGHVAQAIEHIAKALDLKENVSVYNHHMAGFHRQSGDMEAAEKYYRRAIEIDETHTPSFNALAGLKRFDETGRPLLEQIERLLENGKLSDKQRSHLSFAAGKIYNDWGEYDTAFEHFKRANDTAGVRPNMAAHLTLAQSVIFQYGKRYLRLRHGSGSSSGVPIFVVSMPRAGSTLVEQILSSHSTAQGLGEPLLLRDLTIFLAQQSKPPVPFPHVMPAVSNALLAKVAKDYLDAAFRLAGSDRYARLVDKRPFNFFYVGLIRELFPNAKIIHVRRDPMDTCVSCFFQNFPKGVDFSFNLHTLGQFYRIYRRVMDHWEDVLPQGVMMNLDYEDLVANQAETTRKLLAFCGMRWEQRCLEFHKTERNVATTSFWQVRQPIYLDSVAYWRRYEKHLEPLQRQISAI